MLRHLYMSSGRLFERTDENWNAHCRIITDGMEHLSCAVSKSRFLVNHISFNRY